MGHRCSMCKGPLTPETTVVRCSVSSCNAGRMKMRFCSVECWEKHIPTARHRSASYRFEADITGPIEASG